MFAFYSPNGLQVADSRGREMITSALDHKAAASDRSAQPTLRPSGFWSPCAFHVPNPSQIPATVRFGEHANSPRPQRAIEHSLSPFVGAILSHHARAHFSALHTRLG